MAEPGRQRLRIANVVGAGIWLSIGVLGPALLGASPMRFYAAALLNAGWETFVAFLTFRRISLAQV